MATITAQRQATTTTTTTTTPSKSRSSACAPRGRSFTEPVGNHRPVCFGRCLVAKLESGENLLWVSVALILIPVSACLIFVNREFDDEAAIVVDVVVSLLSFVVLGNIMLAHMTEPGILFTVKDKNGSNHIFREGKRHPLIAYRAKFCRETDNCVEAFDHFCPWVGNAIGIRNYPFFICFVFSTVILDIVVDAVSWAAIVHGMDDSGFDGFTDSIKNNIPALLLIIYTLIILVSISPLFCFHVVLLSRNETTNENLKSTYMLPEDNPYHKGCWMNCVSFWCSLGRRRESLATGEMWRSYNSQVNNASTVL